MEERYDYWFVLLLYWSTIGLLLVCWFIIKASGGKYNWIFAFGCHSLTFAFLIRLLTGNQSKYASPIVSPCLLLSCCSFQHEINQKLLLKLSILVCCFLIEASIRKVIRVRFSSSLSLSAAFWLRIPMGTQSEFVSIFVSPSRCFPNEGFDTESIRSCFSSCVPLVCYFPELKRSQYAYASPIVSPGLKFYE